MSTLATSDDRAIGATTLAEAALAAYEVNPAEWAEQNGYASFRLFDRGGSQAFLCDNGQHAILSFRGTQSNELTDWMADLRCRQTKGPFDGSVHMGFWLAFHMIWTDVIYALADNKSAALGRLYITGHSLGAALATIATAHLVQVEEPPAGLVTFGSPRVGNRRFAKTFDSLYDRHFRVVHNNDIVARVPSPIRSRHCGRLRYFDVHGNLLRDPCFCVVLCDRLSGRWQSLGKLGTDGIQDHSMTRYAELIRNHERAGVA